MPEQVNHRQQQQDATNSLAGQEGLQPALARLLSNLGRGGSITSIDLVLNKLLTGQEGLQQVNAQHNRGVATGGMSMSPGALGTHHVQIQGPVVSSVEDGCPRNDPNKVLAAILRWKNDMTNEIATPKPVVQPGPPPTPPQAPQLPAGGAQQQTASIMPAGMPPLLPPVQPPTTVAVGGVRTPATAVTKPVAMPALLPPLPQLLAGGAQQPAPAIPAASRPPPPVEMHQQELRPEQAAALFVLAMAKLIEESNTSADPTNPTQQAAVALLSQPISSLLSQLGDTQSLDRFIWHVIQVVKQRKHPTCVPAACSLAPEKAIPPPLTRQDTVLPPVPVSQLATATAAAGGQGGGGIAVTGDQQRKALAQALLLHMAFSQPQAAAAAALAQQQAASHVVAPQQGTATTTLGGTTNAVVVMESDVAATTTNANSSASVASTFVGNRPAAESVLPTLPAAQPTPTARSAGGEGVASTGSQQPNLLAWVLLLQQKIAAAAAHQQAVSQVAAPQPATATPASGGTNNSAPSGKSDVASLLSPANCGACFASAVCGNLSTAANLVPPVAAAQQPATTAGAERGGGGGKVALTGDQQQNLLLQAFLNNKIASLHPLTAAVAAAQQQAASHFVTPQLATTLGGTSKAVVVGEGDVASATTPANFGASIASAVGENGSGSAHVAQLPGTQHVVAPQPGKAPAAHNGTSNAVLARALDVASTTTPANCGAAFGAAGGGNYSAVVNGAGAGVGPSEQEQQQRVVCLALPSDERRLSEFQRSIRQQLEFFESQRDDVEAEVRGRKKTIHMRQVGIRCRRCASFPMRHRGIGSVYYPAKLGGVYKAAQCMATIHLMRGCQAMSEDEKQKFRKLQESNEGAPACTAYWESCCRTFGLFEAPTGLFFSDNSP